MDDELLFRIGVDPSQLRSGIEQTLSLLGRLASDGSKEIQRLATNASKPLVQLSEAIGGMASGTPRVTAALRAQSTDLANLTEKLKAAATAYGTYLRNQATGTGPKGKAPSQYSQAALEQLQATAAATSATGPFVSAINQEVTRRANAAKAATNAVIAEKERERQRLLEIDREEADDQLLEQKRAAEQARTAADQQAVFTENDLIRRLKQETAERIAERERSAAEEARIAEQLTAKLAEEDAKREASFRAEQEANERIAAAMAERTSSVATGQYETRVPRVVGENPNAFAGTGLVVNQLDQVAMGRNTAGARTADEQAALRMQDEESQRAELSGQGLEAMKAYYQDLERGATASDAFEKATGRVNKTVDESGRALPRLRYAMYDVSITSSILGASMLRVGEEVFKTNIEYDRLFASVSRTSGFNFKTDAGRAQIANLRSELVQLTTTLPVTFEDVTKIATLGGQLGLPAGEIAGFTKTVAEFSATTDVTVDAAATAFGRLRQILHDPGVAQMADEIAFLGVKSVATESQILGLAQSIAVSTHAAGFNTQQTLALATSLASLGIRQDAARGSLIRGFGAINVAVTAGGKSLQDIAAVSGESAAQFKHDWETNAYGAFRNFVGGLGSSTIPVKQNLAELHITAARDVQTFSLLAQNTSVLDDSMKNAAHSTGYLDKAFQQQTNTVAGRITVLQNSFKAMFDTIGNSASTPLTIALTGLINLVNGLTDALTRNPLQAWTLAGAAAMFVLGGAALVLIGVLTRFAGSYVALQQYANEADLSQNKLIATLLRLLGVTNGAAQGVQRLGAAEGGLAAEGDAAAISTGKFSTLLGRLGLAGAVLTLALAMPTIIQSFKDWQNQINGTVPGVDKLTQSILGLTQAGSKVQSITALETALTPFRSTLPNGLGRTLPNYTETYGTKNGQRTINSSQAAVNEITAGTATPGGSLSPIQSYQFADHISDSKKSIQDFDTAISQLISAGHMPAAQAALAQYDRIMQQNGVSQKQAEAALVQTTAALQGQGQAGLQAAAGSKAAADAAQQAGQVFTQTLQAIFGQGIADQKVTTDLGSLGKEIQSAGSQSALGGQTITTALGDIYSAAVESGGGAKEAASNMLGLAQTLQNAGLASTSAIQGIISAAQTLDPAAQATKNYGDTAVSAYQAAANAAAKSATSQTASIAKTVRTVEDYGNELASVMTRAFNFRTGDQTATDAFNKGLADLKTNAADAATNLAKVRAELLTLQGARGVLEYQMGVAQKYGDTTREGVLQGQLATNTTDIAAKQKEIAAAHDAASKALTGNSAAAIDNRSKLLALVQSGQSLLTTMAANGSTQADLTKKAGELKQQFIDQATQMGYNRTDVGKLARSFDDFKTIISQIPRNVTVAVDARTNPAEVAIKEFLAKNQNLSIPVAITPTSSTPRNVGVGHAIYDGVALGFHQQVLDRQAALRNSQDATVGYTYPADKSKNAGGIDWGKALQVAVATIGKTIGFSSGGYTGDGAADELAGFVHRGEFVLNQRATQLIPRQVLESWNSGRPMQVPQVTNKITVDAGSMLSRSDRAFLAAALTHAPAVQISASQVGRAVDATYVRAGQKGAN